MSPQALLSVLTVILAGFVSGAAVSHELKGPCASDKYGEFDFWLGDWQVFKRESGRLAGVDMIEKTLNGCALRQRWIQLDDSFRPTGIDNRLRGESLISVLPDGSWRQTWADNSGFFITLTGGLNDRGVMMLESGPVRYERPTGAATVFFRWRWQKQKDGTIRNWGETKIGDEGKWETSFDNIYRPNR